ncbi:NUDIX hydrolase [Bergeyella cardium]|uniref:NUDIX domain-containing protein n=1 Tax=Bergeyella cardium TaxID=1585976 RepID=A0A6P1QZ97_9FLAO|nr:NUDIX domain-containing protein [Bergeyella cardium]QHN66024.1 NUDIX domain-containing protein [Bergeyella cardium]WHE33629.1 NUDIX domain-containing protein [Bergeyella cardium]WHF60279.1 NUDIX domain-containing protein [Bergeyella cardium]
MYKVFINEKKISLTKSPESTVKILPYEGAHTIEIAMDLIKNTSTQEINIYSTDIGALWQNFKSQFRIVEAAGGIVKNTEGKVLFIYRLNKWDLPKGKIEKGETYENAALREVEEETHLRHLVLGLPVMTTYHIYTEKNGDNVLKMTHWFQMEYTGNEQLIPQTEEGITDVQWLDEEDIYLKVLPNTFKNIHLVLNQSGVAEDK